MARSRNVKNKLAGIPARAPGPRDAAQVRYLRAGTQALAELRARGKTPRIPGVLEGQPFDRELLSVSPLFRKSRAAYLELGGVFVPSFVSSARSLASPSLLDPVIEYSAIEREFFWAAAEEPGRLLQLRTVATSLFHEQNHRLLWSFLPRAQASARGLRRLLNLAESLVIALDMALGDELGPRQAHFFYATGATYDPGTMVRDELSGKRDYRNYLQATVHATYLSLQLYEPRDIPRAIEALFPSLGPFAKRAAMRAATLDRGFISRTNLRWQARHRRDLLRRLSSGKGPRLEARDNPLDNREAYLLGERWFAFFGL